MTHDELAEIASNWLKKRCGVVFKEMKSNTLHGEIPDVIGFKSHESTLIECKVSRSDFLKDKKNIFRINPDIGMGDFRFYCCPNGVITKDDLPKNWGLLYVSENRKCRIKFNPYNEYGGNIWRYGFGSKCIRSEMQMMYSSLRRLSLRSIEINPKL